MEIKTITMGRLKELIWKIDQDRFGGEVRKAKGRVAIGYHRDAPDTFLPYKISVDRQYIHIGAPGTQEQIQYFQRQYGLQSAEETLTAIAENILVELAYDLYNLDSERKSQLVECTIHKLFDRRQTQTPEIVYDVWGVILSQLPSGEIRRMANINPIIHDLAVRELRKRRPLVEALRDCVWKRTGCSSDDECFKIIADQLPLYPQEASMVRYAELVEEMRCPELLKIFRKSGIDVLNAIYKYRKNQSDFLKRNNIYSEKEVDAFDRKYISQTSRRERKPVAFIKKKFDENSYHWI